MKNIIICLTGAWMFATLTIYAQERRLSLREALALAQLNNKELKVEMLEANAAREATEIVKASMLPVVAAGAGYSYYFDRQVIFMPGSFTGDESRPVVDVAVGGKNFFNSQLSLYQPVIAESSRKQIKASRINETIQDIDVKENYAKLILLVTTTYYKALLLEESVELNKQSLLRNRMSLEDSRMLLLQGKTLKVDTLRNFIVVENLKTTISYLEKERQVLLLQLGQLLGTKGETLILTDDLNPEGDIAFPGITEQSSGDAISTRHDVQLKELQVELNKNILGQARAQRIPTLSLVGVYQIQAQADHRAFDQYRWPRTSFLGLQANIPIFAGNSINSRIRKSSIDLQSSVLQLEAARDKAEIEIAVLRNDLKEVLERVAIQERTVSTAEMNYRIVNDRYKNGLSSRLELSDAELALTEAKLSHLHLIFNVRITKLQLDKALGLL